jgi:hypothetical protein
VFHRFGRAKFAHGFQPEPIFANAPIASKFDARDKNSQK